MSIRLRVSADHIHSPLFTTVVAAGLWACAPALLSAQTSTPVSSDSATALPIQPVRTLRFTTDEGTWISLDVSPDGEIITFDLLGDLYTVPMSGGQATRLTEGMAFDDMPRQTSSSSTATPWRTFTTPWISGTS
jgi:hypothetical protein